MLTKKQRALLIYIRDHMAGQDIAPSFEEMKNALGLKSKSGIHRLISSLVERGYIRRLPHRARALEICKMPETLVATPSTPSSLRPVSMKESDDATTTIIPMLGKIAAGTPIEAVRDDGHVVAIPPDMLGSGEHYALTVEGDSMMKAGINDGDTVIIKRCDTAENGAIVVALVDREEVTLKRLRRAGNKIVLEPENDSYESRIFEPSRIQIQGRLSGLMRSYDS